METAGKPENLVKKHLQALSLNLLPRADLPVLLQNDGASQRSKVVNADKAVTTSYHAHCGCYDSELCHSEAKF